jgi:hypothetical protein
MNASTLVLKLWNYYGNIRRSRKPTCSTACQAENAPP